MRDTHWIQSAEAFLSTLADMTAAILMLQLCVAVVMFRLALKGHGAVFWSMSDYCYIGIDMAEVAPDWTGTGARKARWD